MLNRATLYACLAIDLVGYVPSPAECKENASAFFADADPVNFRKWSQLVNINRKRVVSDDRLTDNAIQHFMSTEQDLIRFHQERGWRSCKWFEEAKHHVYRVLGVLAHSEQEIFDQCRFGPGAVFTGEQSSMPCIVNKLGGVQSLTPGLIPHLSPLVENFSNWYNTCLYRNPVKRVPGNRLGFVPKDETKYRQIAVEPSLNMFLQLGVGETISRLLRDRAGIDIRDQSRNQRLAKEGSISGSVATVDLSDASNRICIALVEDLLPADWYLFLRDLRSHCGLMPDGSSWVHRAFSTQGNGFTFPLETLIFWAIARAMRPSVLSVYGDDICISSDKYADLSEAFDICGFKINQSKSYHVGPFRESCGADYLNGINVRSVFLKEDPENPCDIYDIHNRLMAAWSHIPETLRYLRSLVRKPSFGPRYTISDGKGQSENYISDPSGRWFWEPDSSRWTEDFGYVTTNLKASVNERARYLAFLYGGSESLDIPLSKKYNRGRFSSALKKELAVDEVPARQGRWGSLLELRRTDC